MERQILDKIPSHGVSDFGKDIFPQLLQEKFPVKGYITDSFVLAIDTKEALDNATKYIDKNR